MGNIYEFMSDSPVLTFIIIISVGIVIEMILKFCIREPLRAMNIRKHGWPPSHCDSDGDFKSYEDD